MLLPFPYLCVVSHVHQDHTRCSSAVLGGSGLLGSGSPPGAPCRGWKGFWWSPRV